MITQHQGELLFAWVFTSIAMWGGLWIAVLYFTAYDTRDVLRLFVWSLPNGVLGAAIHLPSAWHTFLLDAETSAWVFAMVYGVFKAWSDEVSEA